MNTIFEKDDQKAPCFVNVHFHALLTQRLGLRCYRSQDIYKFETADKRFVHTWRNMWGKWIIKHNIRTERKLSDWEEADFLGHNWTSIERDFRMLGMGMITSDLNNFTSFVKCYFDPEDNILLHPEKRQLKLFDG